MFRWCTLAFLFAPLWGVGQERALVHSFFFVGDAGASYVSNMPLGDVLHEKLAANDDATVVFLGDNIYPAGLSERSSRRFTREAQILAEQVSWLEGTRARAVFIPGNHDWDHWGKNGLSHIKNAESWFDSLKNPQIRLYPHNGCPGPVQIDVFGPHVLFVIDTQWFLHKWEKPGPAECVAGRPGDVLEMLDSLMTAHGEKRIWVAAHHPVITYGDHGDIFTWKDHIFPLTDLHRALYIPLPILGSIYPLFRRIVGHPQDTRHRRYRAFSEPLARVLKRHPGSVFVSGHEHALQFIVKDSTHFIVSGSGAKTTSVRKKGYARFARGVNGFVQANLFNDGSAEIVFIQADKKMPTGGEIWKATIR